MIVFDFLFLLITGLISLYPVSKLVKYRDRRKMEEGKQKFEYILKMK